MSSVSENILLTMCICAAHSAPEAHATFLAFPHPQQKIIRSMLVDPYAQAEMYMTVYFNHSH